MLQPNNPIDISVDALTITTAQIHGLILPCDSAAYCPSTMAANRLSPVPFSGYQRQLDVAGACCRRLHHCVWRRRGRLACAMRSNESGDCRRLAVSMSPCGRCR